MTSERARPECDVRSRNALAAGTEQGYDISSQHDKDEASLGVIFNELYDKMTASNHTKK